MKSLTAVGASSAFIHVELPLQSFMRVEGGGELVVDPVQHSPDKADRLPDTPLSNYNIRQTQSHLSE